MELCQFILAEYLAAQYQDRNNKKAPDQIFLPLRFTNSYCWGQDQSNTWYVRDPGLIFELSSGWWWLV